MTEDAISFIQLTHGVLGVHDMTHDEITYILCKTYQDVHQYQCVDHDGI